MLKASMGNTREKGNFSLKILELSLIPGILNLFVCLFPYLKLSLLDPHKSYFLKIRQPEYEVVQRISFVMYHLIMYLSTSPLSYAV